MKNCWRAGLVVFLLSLAGCSTLTIHSRNPAELRERAKNLTALAAGARRTARKYQTMVKKTQKDISLKEKSLDAYRSKTEKLNSRIQTLRKQKQEASEAEAEKVQYTIDDYVDKRDALKAKLNETLIRIRRLKDQVREKRFIKRSHLQDADEMLKRASKLRKRADQLSTPETSS